LPCWMYRIPIVVVKCLSFSLCCLVTDRSLSLFAATGLEFLVDSGAEVAVETVYERDTLVR
jgi:hypothetical protein